MQRLSRTGDRSVRCPVIMLADAICKETSFVGKTPRGGGGGEETHQAVQVFPLPVALILLCESHASCHQQVGPLAGVLGRPRLRLQDRLRVRVPRASPPPATQNLTYRSNYSIDAPQAQAASAPQPSTRVLLARGLPWQIARRGLVGEICGPGRGCGARLD